MIGKKLLIPSFIEDLNLFSCSFLVEPPKFKPTTPVEDIFEAFKNPNHGVGFLEPLPSMPSYTFVSYDAIMWLHNRLEGNVNPIQILETMKR